MTCAKCPNWKFWEKAVKACECCVNSTSSHGVSRVQATEFTINQPTAVDFSREPSGQATRLSDSDERKLREAMSTLFGLDPIDLLLVKHLFNGGSLADFGKTMAKVQERIRYYAKNSDGQLFDAKVRAMAHARKNRIAEAFPAIAPVFKHLISKEEANGTRNPDQLNF